jgi:acyl CoA:acetate/3-ketoacid CoA transferase alpha subunit
MKKGTTCAHAVDLIPDGAALMIGGFMGVGSPHRVIDELVRQGRKNLTVIANDTGRPGNRRHRRHAHRCSRCPRNAHFGRSALVG